MIRRFFEWLNKNDRKIKELEREISQLKSLCYFHEYEKQDFGNYRSPIKYCFSVRGVVEQIIKHIGCKIQFHDPTAAQPNIPARIEVVLRKGENDD